MKKGFTLVELLVVIAILMILFTVVMAVLNPLEITRRARDAARISDLENLRKAIDLSMSDEVLQLRSGSGDSVHGSRAADGTGWVSYNKLIESGLGKYLAVLPVDPTNNSTYYYRFASDGATFELDAKFESADYQAKMAYDGGNNPDWYEIGTSPGLMLLPPN